MLQKKATHLTVGTVKTPLTLKGVVINFGFGVGT